MTSGYPTGWFSPLSLNGCTLALLPEGSESQCSRGLIIKRFIISMFSEGTELCDSDSSPFPHYSRFVHLTRGSLGYNSFLMHTFFMVENPATDSCIYWSKDGCSFVVRSLPEFTDCVLPSYFKQVDFAKFALQLSGFGFRFRVLDPLQTEFAKYGFCRATLVELSAKLHFTPEKPLPDLSQMELKATENVYSRTLANLPALLTRTYCMVDDHSTNNIISWTACRSFTVWNAYKLCRDLLPKYFNHKSFTIFILQLCIAGFRVTTKEDGMVYKFAKEGFGSREERCLLRREIMTDFLSLSQEVRELEQSIVKMIQKSKNQDPFEGEMQTMMNLKVDTWALKLKIEKFIQSSLDDFSEGEDDFSEGEDDFSEVEEFEIGHLIMEIKLNMDKVKKRTSEMASSVEFETTDALMETRLGIVEIKEKLHRMSLQSAQEVTDALMEVMTDALMEIRLGITAISFKMHRMSLQSLQELTDALMWIKVDITEIKKKMHEISLESLQEFTSSPDLEIRPPVMKISEDLTEPEAPMKEKYIATCSRELEEIEQGIKELIQMIKVMRSPDFRRGPCIPDALLEVTCQFMHITSFVHKVRQANAYRPDCSVQSQIISPCKKIREN